MTHLVALTGPSGSGKDTLADLLVKDYGYERFSFGDFLRKDVIAAYGEPESKDERSTVCYPDGLEREACKSAASTKDAMLKLGGYTALTDPLKYSASMCAALEHQVNRYTQPIVITDMRKPVEMRTLAAFAILNQLHTYFVAVSSQTRGEQRRLDGLLTGDRDHDYVENCIRKPELPEFHGHISNDGQPEDMLTQLSFILELTVPYTWQ